MWGTHYEPPKIEAAREAFQDEMMERAKGIAAPNPNPAAWRRNLMGTVLLAGAV